MSHSPRVTELSCMQKEQCVGVKLRQSPFAPCAPLDEPSSKPGKGTQGNLHFQTPANGCEVTWSHYPSHPGGRLAYYTQPLPPVTAFCNLRCTTFIIRTLMSNDYTVTAGLVYIY